MVQNTTDAASVYGKFNGIKIHDLTATTVKKDLIIMFGAHDLGQWLAANLSIDISVFSLG